MPLSTHPTLSFCPPAKAPSPVTTNAFSRPSGRETGHSGPAPPQDCSQTLPKSFSFHPQRCHWRNPGVSARQGGSEGDTMALCWAFHLVTCFLSSECFVSAVPPHSHTQMHLVIFSCLMSSSPFDGLVGGFPFFTHSSNFVTNII